MNSKIQVVIISPDKMKVCHVIEMSFAVIKICCSAINPIIPDINVISIWLKLATIVTEMVFNLFPSGKYSTLPKYSPILYGVETEKDTPDSTAFNDLKKDIAWMSLITSFHFKASIPQFTKTSAAALNRYIIL